VGESSGLPGTKIPPPPKSRPKIVTKAWLRPPAKALKKLPPRPEPQIAERLAERLPEAKAAPRVASRQEDQQPAGIGLPVLSQVEGKVEENSGLPKDEGKATAGRGSRGEGRGQGEGFGGKGPEGGGGALAKPDYATNPTPPYPLLARRMGAEGVVVLRILVHEDGSVKEVKVRQSSGFKILDESALRTVRDRWHFLPARLNDKPVTSWVEVPIRFVLKES